MSSAIGIRQWDHYDHVVNTLMNFTINLVPASYQGSAVNSFEQYIDTLDSKQVNELLSLLDDAPPFR